MRYLENPNLEYVEVTDKELQIIDEATRDLVSGDKVEGQDEAQFLDELNARAEQASDKLHRLGEIIGRFASQDFSPIVIFDLPLGTVESVGPTPLEFKAQNDANIYPPDRWRGFLLGLGRLYSYGYTSQQSGLIHNDIMPVRRLEHVDSISANALQKLDLHTEDASFRLSPTADLSPDVLSMHFFRNHERTPTILAVPQWDRLSKRTMEVLKEDVFRNQTSFLQGGPDNDLITSGPIIFTDPEKTFPQIVFNSSTVTADTEAGNLAVAELKCHLEAVSMEVGFETGQVVLIDNRKVVHGRAAQNLPPKYDGTDRWQRRLVAARDASRIVRYQIRPRVVDPQLLFADKSSYSPDILTAPDQRSFPDGEG